MNTKIKHCRVCGCKLKIKVKKGFGGNKEFECTEGKKINDAWMCNGCIADIKEN